MLELVMALGINTELWMGLAYLWNNTIAILACSVGSATLMLCWLIKEKYPLQVSKAFFGLFGVFSVLLLLDVSFERVFWHIAIINKYYFMALEVVIFVLVYAIPNFVFNLICYEYHKKAMSFIKKMTLILILLFLGVELSFPLLNFSMQTQVVFRWILFSSVPLMSLFCFYLGIKYKKNFDPNIMQHQLGKWFFWISVLFYIPICFDIFRVYNPESGFFETVLNFRFYALYYLFLAIFFMKGALRVILQDLPTHSRSRTEDLIRHYKISKREIEIVKALVEGFSNKEIALLLFISEHTVRRHIQNIYEKLEVSNRLAMMQKLQITSLTLIA